MSSVQVNPEVKRPLCTCLLIEQSMLPCEAEFATYGTTYCHSLFMIRTTVYNVIARRFTYSRPLPSPFWSYRYILSVLGSNFDLIC